MHYPNSLDTISAVEPTLQGRLLPRYRRGGVGICECFRRPGPKSLMATSFNWLDNGAAWPLNQLALRVIINQIWVSWQRQNGHSFGGIMGDFEERFAALKAEESFLEGELITVKEYLAEFAHIQSLIDNPLVPLRRVPEHDEAGNTAPSGEGVRRSPLVTRAADTEQLAESEALRRRAGTLTKPGGLARLRSGSHRWMRIVSRGV